MLDVVKQRFLRIMVRTFGAVLTDDEFMEICRILDKALDRVLKDQEKNDDIT